MNKTELLEKYFLEEVKSSENYRGWKVYDNIKIPSNLLYTTFNEIYHLRTKTEGWLDVFEIVVTNTGLILLSPECPDYYFSDNIEGLDICGIISQLILSSLNSYTIMSGVSAGRGSITNTVPDDISIYYNNSSGTILSNNTNTYSTYKTDQNVKY